MLDDQVATVIDLTGDDETDFLPPPSSQNEPKTGDKRPHQHIADPESRITPQAASVSKAPRTNYQWLQPLASHEPPASYRGFGYLVPNPGFAGSDQRRHMVYAHNGNFYPVDPRTGPSPYVQSLAQGSGLWNLGHHVGPMPLQQPPIPTDPYLTGFQPHHGLAMAPPEHGRPAPQSVSPQPLKPAISTTSTVDYRVPGDGGPRHHLSALNNPAHHSNPQQKQTSQPPQSVPARPVSGTMPAQPPPPAPMMPRPAPAAQESSPTMVPPATIKWQAIQTPARALKPASGAATRTTAPDKPAVQVTPFQSRRERATRPTPSADGSTLRTIDVRTPLSTKSGNVRPSSTGIQAKPDIAVQPNRVIIDHRASAVQSRAEEHRTRHKLPGRLSNNVGAPRLLRPADGPEPDAPHVPGPSSEVEGCFVSQAKKGRPKTTAHVTPASTVTPVSTVRPTFYRLDGTSSPPPSRRIVHDLTEDADENDFSGVSPAEASPSSSRLLTKSRPRLRKQASPNADLSSSPRPSPATLSTQIKPESAQQPPGASGHTPASLARPAAATTTATSEYKCYAVRVGWFPGIYDVKDHCRYLTMHYPKREVERANSRAAAQAWLDKSSVAAKADMKWRPTNYRNIEVEGWIHYLERTWLARDAEDRPHGKKQVMAKLRHVFIEACELEEDQEIDWSQHPLPQQLLRKDQLCDYITEAGLDDRYIRTKEEFLAPKRVCSCGAPAPSGNDVVTCENSTCKTVNYHKRCVGLVSRPNTSGWRCRHCRPTLAPQPSQAPPPCSTRDSGGQRPSTPPPHYNSQIPDAARPVVIKGPSEPALHAEQAKVVDCIMSGKNVFYTGSAGTGKSTVLKEFVKQLRAAGKHVDMIAPSGIAALNVGGTTIFSYAGWVPDSFKMPLHELAEKSRGKVVHKRLCMTDILVIDEISMVESHMLERLDNCMRLSRSTFIKERERDEDGRWVKNRSLHNAKLPFGGVQVVVTGDFCQLPPVRPFMYCIYCGGEALPGHDKQDGRPLQCNRCTRIYEDREKWAFRSPVWEACDFQCFELRQIHRQSEDTRFIEILQRCRFGIPFTIEDKALLLRAKPDPSGAVQLLPRRNEVEEVNRREFNRLTSNALHFQCVDFFKYRSHDQPELKRNATPRYPNQPNGPLLSLKDHRLEEQVHLKQGMLVILLVNLDFTLGLVNGSQGRIIGFEKHDEHRVMASLFPQQDRSNKPGSPSGSNLAAKGISELQHTKQEQIRHFISRANVRAWPIVQFHNGTTQTIYAQCQVNELGLEQPYSFLGRTQIPLLAAWAITVHKSQGMTLNRVIVDLWSSFEREMVYVALSRARGLAGLKVRRLAREGQGRKDQSVNEEVHEFLRENDLLGGKKGLKQMTW